MTAWQASFHRLQDSTHDDWERLLPFELEHARGLTARVLDHLRLLDGDAGGFPVNRLRHSLLAATRAQRDGRDDEYVVCALLHDIGDSLAPWNHADLAATMLEPFVSEANAWMLRHHAVLQGEHFFHHIGLDRHMHRALSGHEHYERTREFVELYDNPAFDPAAEVEPLDAFEPMLRRVLARPQRSLYDGHLARLDAPA